MATFTALNIEYDNATDEEIDDTKEIQIEDALKLYQTALKYHAEGPASFPLALDAYTALFQSEIFKYPESQSHLRRQELYGLETDYDDVFEEDFTSGPVQLATTGESAPNTLPQILHLAYKNHGELILDMLDAKIRREREADAGDLRRNATSVVKSALLHFSEALDKDDTDLDLWVRTAVVGALVGSERVSRYCLEAILDDEDEGVNGVLALPGVAEGFAVHKLREQVQQLQDDLGLKLQPLARLRKKRIAKDLLLRLTPYNSIQLPPPPDPPVTSTRERTYLRPAARSWGAVGEAILRQYQSEQNGFSTEAGVAIGIDAPRSDTPQQTVVNEDLSKKIAAKETINSTADTDMEQTGEEPQATAETSEPVVTAMETDKSSSTLAADHEAPVEEQNELAEQPADEADQPSNNKGDPPENLHQGSRKRSSDSAGLQEEEGTRTRSKRLKARESIIAEKEEAVDPMAADQQQATEKLQTFTDADRITFDIVGALLQRLGIDVFRSPEAIKASVNAETPQSTGDDSDMSTALRDLYAIAEQSAPEVVGVLLNPASTDSLGGNSREAGLNAFLGFAKSGVGKGQPKPKLGSDDDLDHWLGQVNEGWMTTPQLALSWIQSMLQQVPLDDHELQASPYRRFQWTDELKRTIIQLIVLLDEILLRQSLNQLSALEKRRLDAHTQDEPYTFTLPDEVLIEMVQTLFELHLDVYSLVKQPGAGVDLVTQIQAKDRLERWSDIAHQAFQLRAVSTTSDRSDELTIRHLWATAFHLSVCDVVAQEHVILCMNQLKVLLEAEGHTIIELQNNAVMPELSVSAIERELSRIHMKDFFLKVFADDEKSPVDTIEMLEPILELGMMSNAPASQPDRVDSTPAADEETAELQTIEDQAAMVDSPAFKEMSKFLESSTVSLRLSLWQRLREAYEAIDYQPKVVSCYLKCMELLTTEIKSATYRTAAAEQRYFMLLRWLRLIDDILIKVLAKTSTISGQSVHLDCIDATHLRSTLTALAELSMLLHSFDLFEDSVRVGVVSPPIFDGSSKQTFSVLGGKVHDLQLRLWMLSFALLKEAMIQEPAIFTNANEDKLDYLRAIHHATGVRGYCRASNKAFLRLLKEEMLRMSDLKGVEIELSQALYDLYGIICCPDAASVVEHGASATSYEPLTKKTAAKIIVFVMAQAARVPEKDLPKLELKASIDKIHGALGKSKITEATQANKRAVAAYLKAAIPPLELFRCLDGVSSITAQPVSASEYPAAAKGWYFLMGTMALNRYLATRQKNVSGTTNDDLIIAVAFFMQDLEFSFDRWETWYCLAQCYDMQLEEAVMFSAEKINTGAPELQAFQRSAIHCYTMSVARATNTQDASDATVSKVAKMYSDFGTRIYSSSRQPFAMEVFKPREAEARFFSKPDESQTPMRGYAFHGLEHYTAWKFAAALFRRAIARSPHRWWSHYMLGKCLWKMYTADDAVRNHGRLAGSENYKPSMHEVLEALTAAVQSLPQKKDNRREREPILEPHYKIVAIAHKLVLRKEIEAAAAAEIVQVSDLCSKVPKCEDLDGWEHYVLQVLKALRAVDKANWHHRMTARAAHVIYDDSRNEVAAMGAKHELTQQIFTRTMAVQVWKPENERAGRHFVYTTRYTRFFVMILCQLEDRVNMDALSKRLRRKPQDFYDHGELWREFCMSYLKLLRRWGRIPEGHEDAVFKSLSYEDFVGRAVRLEMWCQNPNTKSPLLDVLRDVIELKKVNNGLMKATLIDDLVGDAYAKMYADVGPSLDNEPLPPEVAAQLASQREQSRPATVQVDGTVDGVPAAVTHEAPGRPRAKGVGRRELQRRAEAAVTAPVRAPPPLPVRTSTSAQVVIPTSGPTARLVPPASGDATAASSAPGSDQDDADNESELSELDDADEPEAADVIVVRPLFPNLRKDSSPKKSPPLGVKSEGAAPAGDETREDEAKSVAPPERTSDEADAAAKAE